MFSAALCSSKVSAGAVSASLVSLTVDIFLASVAEALTVTFVLTLYRALPQAAAISSALDARSAVPSAIVLAQLILHITTDPSQDRDLPSTAQAVSFVPPFCFASLRKTCLQLMKIDSILPPALAALSKTLNNHRPAHRLPPEILLQVFSLVGSGSKLFHWHESLSSAIPHPYGRSRTPVGD